MKIALFSWEALHACVIGGVSAHISGLATALSRKGHEVHLFTREAPGRGATDLINGVHYHRCPWSRQDNFLDEVRAFNHSLVYYYQEISSAIGGFDILHCHDWLTFPAGERLRNEGRLGENCRWIATFHTTEWGRSGQWPEQGEGQRIARWEKNAIDNADAVVFVSEEVRRQANLLYQCPDWKSRIVYHGIDTLPVGNLEVERNTARAALGLSPTEPVALFVGTLSEKKGLDILLDGLPATFAAAPDSRLVVAGEGPLLQRLKDAIVAAHWENRIVFAPVAETWQIARLYPASDVVAIPYRYDPFGIVALSAWAATRPIVVCGHGAAAEFTHDTVTGLKTSPEDFGKVLGGLLADLERAQWLGYNGRAAADTAFSRAAVAELVLSLYRGDNESAWKELS